MFWGYFESCYFMGVKDNKDLLCSIMQRLKGLYIALSMGKKIWGGGRGENQ